MFFPILLSTVLEIPFIPDSKNFEQEQEAKLVQQNVDFLQKETLQRGVFNSHCNY